MIRGTTPTHEFNLPIETKYVEDLRISYAQGGEELIVKNKKDCILDGNKITLELTQEETFKFSAENTAKVQLRIKTTDGKVMSSNFILLKIEQSLNEEVL